MHSGCGKTRESTGVKDVVAETGELAWLLLCGSGEVFLFHYIPSRSVAILAQESDFNSVE